MSGIDDYRRERGNDLDEDPAFEQGRSYLRDFADAAIAEQDATIARLKCCANCEACSWAGGRCYANSDKVTWTKHYDHCHFTPSRWNEKQAEATIDRLNVCGNCGVWWDNMTGRENGCLGRPAVDPCHFTPSRWVEQGATE